MKAFHWTHGLAAAAIATASGTCFADVGLLDGRDSFADFHSLKTRAEVHQEYLDARSQGLLRNSGNAEFSGPDTSGMDIGARGPAGSRYQARTREEVMDELRTYRQTHNPAETSSIYFGE